MKTLRPIFSLLLGLFFLIVGHGMQIALIPLRAKAEGWSDVEIGGIGSAYYIGFVLGCIGAPHLIRRAGHIRAFTALVAVLSSAMVAHPLWVAFPVWFGLRMLLGVALAGLYMVLESWVNDRASNTNRGLSMSAYIMVNYGALALGQVMVTLYSPLEFSLFAIAAISMSLAAIPLALTQQAQPVPVAMVRFRPLALYRVSPVGFIGVTASGIANGSFWSLGAVAAVGVGLSSRDAALFMGIVTAAGAIAQWPVGRFSDRIDRRVVLIVLLVLAVVVGLLFAFLPIAGAGWFILAIFFGAAIAPTYSIAAAHTYDYAAKGTTVETAAGLFLANSGGAIIGPLIAAQVMFYLGSSRLFLFTAVVHAALGTYIFLRLRSRQSVATALKTQYSSGATAPAGSGIAPEAVDPADPNVATPPAEPPLPKDAAPSGSAEPASEAPPTGPDEPPPASPETPTDPDAAR